VVSREGLFRGQVEMIEEAKREILQNIRQLKNVALERLIAEKIDRMHVVCVKDVDTFEPYSVDECCTTQSLSAPQYMRYVYAIDKRRKITVYLTQDVLMVEWRYLYSRGPGYHEKSVVFMYNAKDVELEIRCVKITPKPYMNTGWRWKREEHVEKKLFPAVGRSEELKSLFYNYL
ncbi:MAG: hypothetical protein QXS16_05165, partial [Pyrobaculum sp.]